MATICFAGEFRAKAGRLRKHKDGYCKAVKVIRVLEDIFQEWKKLKSEMKLPDDNSVAQYLLNSLQRPILAATSDGWK